jgi:hypothetical protein
MDVFNALCALTSWRSASLGTGERPLPIRSLSGFKAIMRDGAETRSYAAAQFSSDGVL